METISYLVIRPESAMLITKWWIFFSDKFFFRSSLGIIISKRV